MKLYTEQQVEKMLEAQRGNCYVAVLNATQNEELAKLAGLAPEPGHWRENDYKLEEQPERIPQRVLKNVTEALEHNNDLSKMLDDRISDLHQIKGGQQARHAFILYRQYLWNVRDLLRKCS
jgi:hypothetical protein